MDRVLVIDDDPITRSMVAKLLGNEGLSVRVSEDPAGEIASYRTGDFDLVMTDFFMPGMTGAEVVERIKRLDPEVPVIVLTSGVDLEQTVQLFKHGVDDYILKPVIPRDLVHRAKACIEEARLRRQVKRIEEEKRLVELESQKLVNWRMLYAYKDINQTEQMINLLMRAINSSGGYSWLDILADLPRGEDGSLVLDKDMLDLIVSSASSHRSIIDFLAFVSRIPRMEMELKTLPAGVVATELTSYVAGELGAICRGESRRLSVYPLPGEPPARGVSVDLPYARRICRELVVNALKYSAPGTEISFEIGRGSTDSIGGKTEGGGKDSLIVKVRNEPRQLQAVGRDGNRVVGIPYEYSELVFDLFFTIDNFPTPHPAEEWPDGTGLYIVRKLLSRMGAVAATSAGVDYSGSRPRPIVQVGVAFPFRDAS